YLVDYILFPNESDDTFVASVYKLGEDYDITEPEQIQLLIYLYTHCIIGEANFYSRNIAASRKPIYEVMLARLEITIRENFTSINLDNKLEYLVCCRILSVESSLFDPI